MNPQEQSQPNPQADAVFKALAYTENGGRPGAPVAGKTGEMKSTFQFLPSTWKSYAKQVTGQDLELTPEHEAYVVHKKVSDWLNDGYTPQQIASMWNAGERRPDAYKQGWKGVNKKYGVEFDTPGYVKKFDKFLSQFSGSNQLASAEQGIEAPASIEGSNMSNSQVPLQNKGLYGSMLEKQPSSKKEGLLGTVMKNKPKKEGLINQI